MNPRPNFRWLLLLLPMAIIAGLFAETIRHCFSQVYWLYPLVKNKPLSIRRLSNYQIHLPIRNRGRTAAGSW